MTFSKPESTVAGVNRDQPLPVPCPFLSQARATASYAQDGAQGTAGLNLNHCPSLARSFRRAAYENKARNSMTITPRPLFNPNSVQGWGLNPKPPCLGYDHPKPLG